jgi:hypothetical protein
MKFIKSKLIKRGKRRNTYQITLQVTDYDIEMFEEFALSYAPFDINKEITLEKENQLLDILDMKKRYRNYLLKVWHCFWKLWNTYDEK